MKNKGVILVLALTVFFWFHGTALADGGGPEIPAAIDCDCLDDMNPTPTSGPFLLGEFTVARDRKSFEEGKTGHFVIHVTLRRLGEVHLFHWWRAVPAEFISGESNLCDLTDAFLKYYYRRLACDMEVEQYFGLTGTPLIYSLCVTQRECVEPPLPMDTPEQMIKGVIVVRVVPKIQCQ